MNTWHLKSKFTKMAAALGLATAAIVAQPAMAGSDRVTVNVAYGDLNLTTEEGQDELQSRVDRAAKKVCRIGGKRTLSNALAERACYQEAHKKVSVQMASLIRDNKLGG